MSAFKDAVKIAVVAVCVAALTAGSVGAYDAEDYFQKIRAQGFNNVIVMIPDGCDETVQTMARWLKGSDLQVDRMATAAVKVHIANSVIPGSAAAGTAFATGNKTTVRFLGVGPRTDDLLSIYSADDMASPYAPVASVLEAARLAGKSTGLVATSRITHATPAAFGCHIEDRGWDNDIMEHLVYNNIDVVFGGGFRHLIPEGQTYNTSFGAAWGGRRTDGEDLHRVLLERGYQFVDNRDDMLSLRSGKAWGLFDDSHMQPDIDRQWFAEHEPSLAEMTEMAIELLSQNPNGFFLMVEGSQVDWAGHNNDPIYMATDFLAFDDAVKVACDFAERDGATIVTAFPDHNTGGMKIGHYDTAMGYTETTVEDLLTPLSGMATTANGIVANLPEMPTEPERPKGFGGGRWFKYGKAKKEYREALGQYKQAIMDTVREWWALEITAADVDEIIELAPSVGLSYALARVVSKNHTVIGWTTHGHNGETVPVWVYGAEAPAGTIDNTDLARIAAEAMGVNLSDITSELYVDLATTSVAYVIDNTDPENLVLKANDRELPISKDYMNYMGSEFQLPGLTVYAPATQKVYVSAEALGLLSP
jgi:alkaline phosphatase